MTRIPGADILSGWHPATPVRLETTPVPPGARLLVAAPHPDDFDAIAVALRSLHARGHTMRLLVMTSGSSGVEDSFCTPPTAEAKGRAREAEQLASCAFFGLPAGACSFLRMAEDQAGDPQDSAVNEGKLRAEFAAFRPDLVFLPHGHDTNAGHRVIAAMVDRIASGAGRPIAALLNRDPKTIAMRPDVYAAFGEEQAEWKAELLRFHRSQHVRNLHTRGYGFDERILRANREIARDLGLPEPYAEVFELKAYLAS